MPRTKPGWPLHLAGWLLLLVVQEVQALSGYQLDLTTGYRRDQLQWNIASDLSGRQSPNILSELTWDPVEIWTLALDAELNFVNGVTLNGGYQHGEVIDGDSQDSDYLTDNRGLEFSRSNNGAGGYTEDMQLSVGYRQLLLNREHRWLVSVTPYLGYAHRTQHFKAHSGVQTVSLLPGIFTPPLGPFPGLDSFYEANWRGPLAGLEVGLHGHRHELRAALEYQRVAYQAHANWNLRQDFAHPVSFEHDADGSVWQLQLSYSRSWKRAERYALKVLLEMRLQQGRTEAGTSQTFFRNGRISGLRLNEVDWRSNYVGVGANYQF